MQMHEISSETRGRRGRRVGRGGKRGTYSGRGMKGQRARAGGKLRPALRDFVKSVPKLRGQEFPAMPHRARTKAVNLSDLQSAFRQGGAVTPKTLVSSGLLSSPKTPVKLLGGGEAPKGLLVRGIAVSRAARKKIEDAGGTVEEISKS